MSKLNIFSLFDKFTRLRPGLANLAYEMAVFDSSADREAHMTMFETRLQCLNETEEEFMLILVKLYEAANHKVKAEDLNREVKRKFLHGIPDPLPRNLFIFCSNPLDDSVSHQVL